MIGQREVQREQVKTLHRVFDLNVIEDWTTAIDGGAHVGTWAAAMAARFGRVIAFEPTFETFGYLTENLFEYPNVECRNEALMDSEGWVAVVRPRRSRKKLTSRFVERKRDGDVRCLAIDDLGLSSCGLIKLDLEGAEPLALQGALETILRCRPVLIVEIKRYSARFGWEPENVHKYVIAMNYKEVMRENVDRVYAPI